MSVLDTLENERERLANLDLGYVCPQCKLHETENSADKINKGWNAAIALMRSKAGMWLRILNWWEEMNNVPKIVPIFTCYMKSVPGNDDYRMFVNEQPEGGFKWSFLDYKPKDIENYQPVYISHHPVKAYIGALIHENGKLKKELEKLKAKGS